jgi:hypothetical protein
LGTGILKNTTGTGAHTIAVAGDFPTLNQNTTGTADNVTGIVGVSNGGTGQTTYADGQLLIGNTAGNILVKNVLTGTPNQVAVTNGAGAITLSTPQDIATNSNPVFNNLTLNGTSFWMPNSATIYAKNSAGTYESFLIPRSSENKSYIDYNAGLNIRRNNGGNTAMYMTSTGNVGIGTSTPVVPLNFANILGNKIALWANDVNNHYGFGIQPSLLQIYTDSSGSDIAFGHGSSGSLTETMRIKGNGNVGIGTDSPIVPLTFGIGLGNKIAVHPHGYGGNNHYGFGIQANLLQMYAVNGAAIAFGTGSSTNFTQIMRVGGTADDPRVVIGHDPGGTDTYAYPGHLVVWGAAFKYGLGGTWAIASDKRLKKEIAPFTGALDKITLLEGKKYKWRNPRVHFNQTEEQFGFIAQEVEKIFPTWIEEVDAAGPDKLLTEGKKMKTISLPLEYNAYVVEAIKELKALGESRTELIDVLKAQIEAQKTQLEIQRKELDLLKSKH